MVRPQTVEDDVGRRRGTGPPEEHGLFAAITDQLLDEAIQKFNEPYDKPLAALEREGIAFGRPERNVRRG
ncbi:MAG: hypothetical protein R3E12_11080 [Candidatus Eisenbacteria bacterium]